MKKPIFTKILLFTLIIGSTLSAHPNIQEIATEAAPRAIGPYSQAVRAGQYLYVSGQLPINPLTGTFSGDTIEEQTAQVLNNIEAILQAQGLTFEYVVKAEVYMKDLNDFKNMNAVYASRFTASVKPARQTMQIAKLPMDALIEISCIAFIPEGL